MTGARDEGQVLVVGGEGDLWGGLAATLRDRYAVRVATDPRTIPRGLPGTDVVLIHTDTNDTALRDVLTVLEGVERDRPLQVGVVSSGTPPSSEAIQTYLESPVTTDHLHETVERLLSRADYDAQLRRYFSVAARVAVLETRSEADALDADGEYNQATTRAEQIRASLEAVQADLSDDDLFTVAAQTANGKRPGEAMEQ